MRTPSFVLVALLLACAPLSAPTAFGQTQQEVPCSAAEYRQMDFWLGDWDVRWNGDPGQGIAEGRGRNVITRELGACVIQEAFRGGPTTGDLTGRSVSIFHRREGVWRQTWVDNHGGYFALTGGPVGDRFILTSTRLGEDVPHNRMVFEEITVNSLTWRWQRSADGQIWSDSWVIYYTRR